MKASRRSMAKKRLEIVMTYPFFPAIVREQLEPLARVRIARNPTELRKLLASADGLMTRFSDPVDEKLLMLAPKLRAVANFAVGVDNIDLKACQQRGIRVTNTPD